MTPTTAASGSAIWEVVLLRRRPGSQRARVAGRVRLEAPDVEAARRDAEAVLRARSDGEVGWALGVLRPLAPRARGTHRYRVVFSVWEPEAHRFVRRDVHELAVWAEDAASARRLAQQEIQRIPGYRPAWRIRRISRGGRGAPSSTERPSSRYRAESGWLTLAPARRAPR